MAAKSKDFTGLRFGRWLVLGDRQRIRKERYDMTYYLCRCDCGTESYVQHSNLRSGNSRSCGCLGAENALKSNQKAPGYATSTQILTYYRCNARRREIDWGLSREEFLALVFQPCHYCGEEWSMKAKKHKDIELFYNGVDRVDSDGDYVTGNVVPCCKTCNNAKSRQTLDEFRAWVRRVATWSTTSQQSA